MKLKVKKTLDDAILPKKSGPLEAGFDFFVPSSFSSEGYAFVQPGESIRINTGIAVEFPEGYYGNIKPRSSAFGRGIVVEGTIDESYSGSIYLNLFNISKDPITILAGKAYAQLVLTPYGKEYSEAEEVSEIRDTYRGDRGFGSSGNV